MIVLLVNLIILLVVMGLIYWLVTLIPLPEPFPNIIRVLAIIACVLVVLGVLFGGVGVSAIRLR